MQMKDFTYPVERLCPQCSWKSCTALRERGLGQSSKRPRGRRWCIPYDPHMEIGKTNLLSWETNIHFIHSERMITIAILFLCSYLWATVKAFISWEDAVGEELWLRIEEAGNGMSVQPSAKCNDMQLEHFWHVFQEFLRLGPEARDSFNGLGRKPI